MSLTEPPRAELVAAVEAEQVPVDLAGAVTRSGWQNVVLDTRDGWILRFPREHVDFDREMAVLRLLADRVPVQIPRVEWVGQKRRFAAYRKLTGVTFEPDSYRRASSRERQVLADSMAEFLVAMHTALSPAEIVALGLPGPDRRPVELPMDQIPDTARVTVDRIVHDFEAVLVAERVTGLQVCLHHDFHSGNMVLDGLAGRLTGVWDFSGVLTGNGAFDLRYIADIDLVQRIARTYQTTAGSLLDVPAAVVAHRFETVCDYIARDQIDDLVHAVQRWAHDT